MFFEPYARDLANRLQVREGMRVLEIACGTGIVTRKLRERLPPDARLLASGVSEGMLARARGAERQRKRRLDDRQRHGVAVS